jgi:ribonuclease P protein component
MKSALKNKKKIETIFNKGFVVKAKGFLLKGYDFNDDETKFGVSVSKKSFPTAVKRNLIKRRVRHQVKDLGFLSLISKGVSFFLIYTSNEVFSSVEIKKSLNALSKKL